MLPHILVIAEGQKQNLQLRNAMPARFHIAGRIVYLGIPHMTSGFQNEETLRQKSDFQMRRVKLKSGISLQTWNWNFRTCEVRLCIEINGARYFKIQEVPGCRRNGKLVQNMQKYIILHTCSMFIYLLGT